MKKLFLTIASLLLVTAIRADEGMWIPALLQKNEAEMQAMGMKITADDIYSINHSSMKDAVVLFGGGCTGEIVSDQGLLLTNHHCGFDWIQKHSTVEHDYLTEGFWAMTMEEELPCPGLTAKMLRNMVDVTEKILYDVMPETTDEERTNIVKANINRLIEEVQKQTEYKVSVESFYNGNQYFLMYNEIFTDIRMVGAPPSNIGKFGGDTDNWVWPRHTGDFSIFRIYKDGEPYHPDYHFTISLDGVEEGDFTFVFGYPARTNEYLPAVAVNQEANVVYPVVVDLRTKILDIYNKYQEKNSKVRLQYASKHADKGNGWKKWMGVIEGIHNFKGIEKKQAFEKSFEDWCYKERRRVKYLHALQDFNEAYADYEKYRMATTYFTEAGLSIELIEFAANFAQITEVTKDTPQEEIDELVNALRSATAAFYKDYYQPIDEEVAVAMLEAYRVAQPEDFRPEILNEIDKKFKGNVNSYVNYLFSKSIFTSEEKVNKFLDEFKPAKVKKLAKDPAIVAANSMMDFYVENVMAKSRECNAKINNLRRIYMEGQMKMIPEFYP